MPIEAIIFDLDGTLLNSLQSIARHTNATLEAHGLPTHPEKAYKKFVGYGASELIHLASGHQPGEAMHQKLLGGYLESYAADATAHSRLYEGIAQMLDRLETMPVKKAILSNKPHALTLKCHAHFLSRWNFEPVLGHQEKYPKKPDPSRALFIAKTLGIDASEILFVGDTKTDLQTARNAGMLSAGVTWGFRPKKELVKHGADVVIDHPEELPNLSTFQTFPV